MNVAFQMSFENHFRIDTNTLRGVQKIRNPLLGQGTIDV
jgi:hypothetical protein